MSEVGGRKLRVRTVDQLKALELYGKAMGYFAEQREIDDYDGNRPTITVEFVEPVPRALCGVETVTAAPAASSA